MELYKKYQCFGFALTFLFTSIISSAQQDPEYTQYMYNTMSVNPAYAGSTSSLEAVLIHRSQWIGVSGAPQTQSFTIHSPIAFDKMGIGFSVFNDKLGPSDEVRAEGNFSYTIAFANENKLAFGLKFGAKMFNVDWTKGRYYDPMDALLNTNINNEIKPSVGSGFYYYSDKWYLGIAIPNFIRGNYYDDVKESVLVDRVHYYLIGGYVFDFSDSIKFKPSFLFKAVSGAPIYYNVSANFLFSEKVTVGAAYQKDDSVSLLTGFQINPSFYIGYSYDYTTTTLNKYNDGSHEFILRYNFQKKSRQIKSPRFF